MSSPKNRREYPDDIYHMLLQIPCPTIFNFLPVKKHLERSPLEILHHVDENACVWKWIKIGNEQGIVSLKVLDNNFHIEIFEESSPAFSNLLPDYLNQWFDLDRNLDDFYSVARKDDLLSPLIDELYGLRVVGVPDLFEALSWAILGQQVNLTFAYTMKKRLIEQYGKEIVHQDRSLWQFPLPAAIKDVSIEDLMALSISRRKAEYLKEVASLMHSGALSKEKLKALASAEKISKHLCSIRGIGPWTAHYVLLRCLRNPHAYPVGDAGLQNAVKQRLFMERKPTYEELYQLSENWKGWEAYATFYLWNGLK